MMRLFYVTVYITLHDKECFWSSNLCQNFTYPQTYTKSLLVKQVSHLNYTSSTIYHKSAIPMSNKYANSQIIVYCNYTHTNYIRTLLTEFEIFLFLLQDHQPRAELTLFSTEFGVKCLFYYHVSEWYKK